MVVVNAHADPSQPVQGVRVSLSFVAGAEKVVDSRDATNRSGQALLLVSPEAVQRGNLRIEITGVTGLVVFEPADGQLNGLPATITIKMLPQGSLALLGPTQIEAMLHRLSLQNKHLEQENRVVKGELAAAQGQKPDDLAQAMTEWATANGFAAADADKRIQEWAKEIQTRKDQATAEQQELAELALKHYAVAAPMFHKDATDRFAALREKQQRDREEDRKEFQAAVDKQYQSANAYQLASQYHQATQVLEDTRDEAAEQHRISPEDPAYRSIWLDTVLRLADARKAEGASGKASESAALLAQSIKDYRELLKERSAQAERQDWARAQTNLGLALSDQGERSSGSEATSLFAQAVEAYRAALGVYTKADLPQGWAMTQSNLGIALRVQGERSSGAEATELLSAAASAFESVLEVSPTSQSIIKALSHIDHEELFRFDRALELDEQAFKIDPSTGNRMDLVEASLTAAHFSQCVEQAVAIDDPVLSTSKIPVRDTIKLACQWGAGQKAAAQQTATALLPQAAGLHSSGWSFAGTRHFLASSPAFEPGRASWIALFESLEKGDGAAMAAALHQLDAVMNH